MSRECWLRWRGMSNTTSLGGLRSQKNHVGAGGHDEVTANLFQSSSGGKTKRRITWPKKLPVLSGNELVRV